jgi:hypothetical protein
MNSALFQNFYCASNPLAPTIISAPPCKKLEILEGIGIPLRPDDARFTGRSTKNSSKNSQSGGLP